MVKQGSYFGYDKIMRTLAGCPVVLCLAAGLIAQTTVSVKAETWTKTKDNTGLGTSAISKPVSGTGGWSYVYSGHYPDSDNKLQPVKYRIL